MKADLKRAGELCAEGGDWEHKNRLKVYEAIFLLATRDFAGAARQLLDSVATFTSYVPYPSALWLNFPSFCHFACERLGASQCHLLQFRVVAQAPKGLLLICKLTMPAEYRLDADAQDNQEQKQPAEVLHVNLAYVARDS